MYALNFQWKAGGFASTEFTKPLAMVTTQCMLCYPLIINILRCEVLI